MDDAEVKLRRRPVQARSAQTFDHLLETAALLLEDKGWEGFTTNQLAEQAGVNIQTLYRYFPNKLSVIATLSQQMGQEWDDWLADADRYIEEKDFAGAFELFINGVKNQTGGVAVLRALNASPQLKAMAQGDNQALSNRFAIALANKYAHIPLVDAQSVYAVIFSSAIAVIDASFDLPKADSRRMINNCVDMLTIYFTHVVNDPS